MCALSLPEWTEGLLARLRRGEAVNEVWRNQARGCRVRADSPCVIHLEVWSRLFEAKAQKETCSFAHPPDVRALCDRLCRLWDVQLHELAVTLFE